MEKEERDLTPQQQARLREVSTKIVQALGPEDFAICYIHDCSAINVLVHPAKVKGIMTGQASLYDMVMAVHMSASMWLRCYTALLGWLRQRVPDLGRVMTVDEIPEDAPSPIVRG